MLMARLPPSVLLLLLVSIVVWAFALDTIKVWLVQRRAVRR